MNYFFIWKIKGFCWLVDKISLEKNLVATFTLSFLLTAKEFMLTELSLSKTIIILMLDFVNLCLGFGQNLRMFFSGFLATIESTASILEARFLTNEYFFASDTDPHGQFS